LQLVEKIIRGAPILQEMTLHQFHFKDPAVLKSLATVACNAPSENLKWHLNICEVHPNPNMIAVWEEIVTWEKAKSMRVTLEVRSVGHIELLRIIMSDSSCVRDLDVTYGVTNHANFVDKGGPALEMLKILQEQTFSSTCLLTSVDLLINTTCFKLYHTFIDSIPKWTPCVKKLHLKFSTKDSVSGQQIRRKLLGAVRNNMHLQSVQLKISTMEKCNIEKESNADEDCCMLLHRYCERNRKLEGTLEGADSIPLAVWPYIYQLANRGGANMLYRHFCENVGYVLKSHVSVLGKRKRAPARIF